MPRTPKTTCNTCGKTARQLGRGTAANFVACTCDANSYHSYCGGCRQRCSQCNNWFGSECRHHTCSCGGNHYICQKCATTGGGGTVFQCANCKNFYGPSCGVAATPCGCPTAHRYCATCVLFLWTCAECGGHYGPACANHYAYLRCVPSGDPNGYCTKGGDHLYCSTCTSTPGRIVCVRCGHFVGKGCVATPAAAAKAPCEKCKVTVCGDCGSKCTACSKWVCKAHQMHCGECGEHGCELCLPNLLSAGGPQYAVRCYCESTFWHLKRDAPAESYSPTSWKPSCTTGTTPGNKFWACASCQHFVCAGCSAQCERCNEPACHACLVQQTASVRVVCLKCAIESPVKSVFAKASKLPKTPVSAMRPCPCGTELVNMPAFEIGGLGEMLVRALVPDELYKPPAGMAAADAKSFDPLRDVQEIGGQGIDMVVVTQNLEQRKLLWQRLYGEYPPPGHAPKYDFELATNKDKKCLHFFEVKVNGSRLSEEQTDATTFVQTRLQLNRDAATTFGMDVDDGSFTAFAKKAGEKVEKELLDADILGQYCLVRIAVPKLPESDHFDEWVRAFDLEGPNREQVVFTCKDWKDDASTLCTGANPYAFNALKVETYMPYKRQGDIGEKRALEYLACLGYTDICQLQNKKGNGIDVAAKHPQLPGKWCFFEIKSTSTGVAPDLTADERRQYEFVVDRILRILVCKSPKDSFSLANVKNAVRTKAEAILNEVSGVPLPDLVDVWDASNVGAAAKFSEVKSKFQSNCKYFRLNAYLPSYGQSGPVQFELFGW